MLFYEGNCLREKKSIPEIKTCYVFGNIAVRKNVANPVPSVCFFKHSHFVSPPMGEASYVPA